MKLYLKKLVNRGNLLLVAIFTLALLIRFYNFPQRVTFWSEQARSLVVSANYIKEKPSLLGQEYFRVDSRGHKIFYGATFNYSLVPLLLVFNYDPIPVTGYFALLNVATGLVIYLVFKKIFNRDIGLISAFLFLFNDFMIYHSLFIWAYNYLPLVGVLIFYFSWKYAKTRKNIHAFAVGVLSGLGISLQFLFAPLAILALVANMFFGKKKLLVLGIFVAGAIIGNLPMVVFDLRHQFYNTTALFNYFLDTLKGKSDAGFAYYYLLPLWPFFMGLGAYLIKKYLGVSRLFLILFFAVYFYLNLISSRSSLLEAHGMPEGLTVGDVKKASTVIAENVKGDFNVSEILDFDKRGYVLRYYVEFVYGKKPLGEIEYENVPELYVLSRKGYNFEKSDIWEINAGGPYKINLLTDIGEGYGVYKLSK